jgi:transposase
MPAKDVKAYVKRNENDAADAEAICEAVRRRTMRFVGIKSAEQQGRLMQHRTRDLLLRQCIAAGESYPTSSGDADVIARVSFTFDPAAPPLAPGPSRYKKCAANLRLGTSVGGSQ